MDKIRIALIGVGVMGRKYARMLSDGDVKNAELAAVVCRSGEAAAWAEGLKGSPVIYGSADELFAHPDGYDSVLIATPHKTHPMLACRAFELGKHVMCDKPAGITAADAQVMSLAAEKAGRVYGVMFHQRLYPKHLRLKQLLESGELGSLKRIMLVNTRYLRTEHYHSSGSWRSSWCGEGGGALINQGQHILDMWQWLFGMPERIYADIPFGKYNGFKVDDEATIHMRYPGKLTAVFMLSTGEGLHKERLEITGSKGSAVLEDDTLHIWRFGRDCDEYIKNAGVNSREELTVTEEIINFEKTEEPYIDMLENFASAVTDGVPLAAEGASAANALMLTNAAYYSAVRGESVELPLDGEAYARLLDELCNSEKTFS